MARSRFSLQRFFGLFTGRPIIIAIVVIAAFAIGFVARYFEEAISPLTVMGIVAGVLTVLVIASYLNLYTMDASPRRYDPDFETKIQLQIRALRHLIRQTSLSPKIQVEDQLEAKILRQLSETNKDAIKAFVAEETFKSAVENDQKANRTREFMKINSEVIARYQIGVLQWQRNANVNLLIGLTTAVLGIGVMWQSLVSINFEDSNAAWRVADLYRFLARLGLVILIESVAFFFLKLYREDRSMIRYLRNEVTNLEAKAMALNGALLFGSSADTSKILQILANTERNFLIKKDERVMSELTYENSQIIIEQILNRLPGVGSTQKADKRDAKDT